MNLSELRQAARDDLDAGGDGAATDPMWPNNILNRYANRAYTWVRTLISQIDEGFLRRRLEATYDGNAREMLLRDLGLPEEPLAFVGIWDITDDSDQGTQLDHVSLSTAEGGYRSGGSAIVGGVSPAYYVDANEGGAPVLGYRPIPASSRTLRIVYIRPTPKLLKDSDVPDVPVDFHECIALRMVVLAKKREEAPSADHERELDLLVKNAILTLDGRHADRSDRVQVTDSEFYEYQ